MVKVKVITSMKCLSFILLFTISNYYCANAQLIYAPISNPAKTSHLRTAADSSQVSLPFWDDFSTSYVFPDSALWINSENVQVQSGAGIYPPSVNVATFDGANQFGNPYSTVSTAEGIGDSLVSRFIDMSGANQSSTFLSFYYQKEGRGELPDQNDYLRLLIKNDTNTWVEVWRKSGNDLDIQDQFFYHQIKIDLPGYFHEYFQFKFESFGRLAGAFDNWHVDYIYLNDNRRGEQLDLSDHTILNPPTNFFGKYSSVPYDQFISDPEFYLDSSSVSLMNIEAEATNIGTSFELRYQGSLDFISRIDSVVELDINILPFEIRKFNSTIPVKEIFDGLGDSLYLTSFYFINTGDTIDIVNLRANDTVSTNFTIHEDLAYDDGTAEFSTGLNGINSELAYRFFTPIEDQITGIKIYFPNVNTGGTGNAFVLKVWKKLDDDGESAIYTLNASRIVSGLNEYTFYPFNRSVSVKDTFYIGYEQQVEGLFAVGYDKNTNSADNIFYNTGFFWEPNSDLTGSLMIRPVFGIADEEIVTGIEELEQPEIIIYPNPSHGIFNIPSGVEVLKLYDFSGKEIPIKNREFQDKLDLRGRPAGIYFLKILYKGKVETRKLLRQ